MQNQININIAVDVVRALSEKSLCNSIYVMDDSPFGSPGKGTGELSTRCMPGQTIHWVIYAIDLQTPVAIKSISFLLPDELSDTSPAREAHLYGKLADEQLTLTEPCATEPLDKEPSEVQSPDCASVENLELKTWTGIVPGLMPGRKYYYRLELQMGNGKDSRIYIDSLSLQTACFPLCEQEDEFYKPLEEEL